MSVNRIMLLAAQGLQSNDIAAALGVGRVQVGRWRDRYAQAGLAGIEPDLPRGAPPIKVDVSKNLVSARSILGGRTFDMRGAHKAQLFGHPLDGSVRRRRK